VNDETPLFAVERRIAEGERRCVRQRRLIASLANGGHDVTRAAQLLALLENVQAILEQHRERVLEEDARTRR
jgi:hypothetical protein